nr:hypothetical protein [uncultured Undibacterium sp.]
MKSLQTCLFMLFFVASSCMAQNAIVGEWKLVSSGGKPVPTFLKNTVLVIRSNQEIASIDTADLKQGVSVASLVKSALAKGTWKIENNLFFASNSLLKSGSPFKVDGQKLTFDKDPYLSDQGQSLVTVYERRK